VSHCASILPRMLRLRHEPLFLLLGDLAVFYLSLWLTLLVRYSELPSGERWVQHVVPFSIIFAVAILIYFIAGLYDQHTLHVRRRLPTLVTVSQSVTVVVGAVFFFAVPYFGITPKTNLVIFLVLSSVLIIVWRIAWGRFPRVGKPSNVMLLGTGKEVQELEHELHKNPRYRMRVVVRTAPSEVVVSKELQDQLFSYLVKKNISMVIVDTRDPHIREILPVLYNLLFMRADLILLDAMHLYEGIFRKVPVSMLEEAWFIEHITRGGYVVRTVVHRAIDIVVGILVAVVWVIVTPFVWLAIRKEDGGPLYIEQVRVGQHDRPIRIMKFRTMSGSDSGDTVLKSTLKVTKVGKVLRPTRIDELPQCLNMLRGDLSLIGPRPELPALAELYAKEIPYYRARHLIKPGLTGWAQLYHDAHPHHGADVEETRNKLSYDLYYLKHRSVPLDIEIGLKTLKKIVTRAGA
jgi:lipopolysaccharide/colanic/teichoic acid biosynthesis glycosyltransferase